MSKEETRRHGDAETRGEEQDRRVAVSPRPRVSFALCGCYGALFRAGTVLRVQKMFKS